MRAVLVSACLSAEERLAVYAFFQYDNDTILSTRL